MSIRWIPVYDGDVRWSVRVSTPNGDVIDEDVWATDSQEAERMAAESLIPEWGETCEDVAAYVGHAIRVPRYA